MSQVVDNLESNGLLSINQFCFHKGRSVEDQLLVTDGDVVELVESFVVQIIFLGFSKAFDVVNHFIILTKLQMLAIGGNLL